MADDHPEQHAVHAGTTGGAGGSSEEGPRDDEAAAAYIARSRETSASPDDPGISLHEADAAQDLGADDEALGPDQA